MLPLPLVAHTTQIYSHIDNIIGVTNYIYFNLWGIYSGFHSIISYRKIVRIIDFYSGSWEIMSKENMLYH